MPPPHAWFASRCPAPAASAERVREVLLSEIRDTGIPPRSAVPAAPFVLPRSSYAELFRVGRALLDLLHRTVLEIAPTNEGRMAAYGTTDHDYPLFTDDLWTEERYAHCMARPDVAIGPEGPRFLEFNVSGAIGGPVELHCLQQAWQTLYRQYSPTPFTFHDPFAARASLFADVCEELALPRRLAWVGSVRDLKHTNSTRYFDLETDYLKSRGFTARHFEPEDLEETWNAPQHQRYPLGLRHFTIPEWEELGIDTAPVRRALKNGCRLLSPQTSAFLANKQTLGLVSEGRPWMTNAERSLIEQYLPWTRIVTDRHTTYAGKTVELLPHVLRQQERMVLKQGIGMQGLQVVLGRDTPPAKWQALVEQAATQGGSIVQEYVPAQSCPLPISMGPGEPLQEIDVAPVFSPFLFGGRPGGVWARFFTTGAAGIVSREGYGALENAAVAEA